MTVKEYIEKYDKNIDFSIKIRSLKRVIKYNSLFDNREIIGREYDKNGKAILILQGGF